MLLCPHPPAPPQAEGDRPPRACRRRGGGERLQRRRGNHQPVIVLFAQELLLLVSGHRPGCCTRPSSDWFPPRVYPLVPPPIGSRPGYILLSLLRLAPVATVGTLRRRANRGDVIRVPLSRDKKGYVCAALFRRNLESMLSGAPAGDPPPPAGDDADSNDENAEEANAQEEEPGEEAGSAKAEKAEGALKQTEGVLKEEAREEEEGDEGCYTLGLDGGTHARWHLHSLNRAGYQSKEVRASRDWFPPRAYTSSSGAIDSRRDRRVTPAVGACLAQEDP
eukprot:1195980-Prorocentrum_minimum.AAC.3